MSGDLIFEEPPVNATSGRKAGGSPVGLWLDSLREHPGKWAKYPEPVHLSISTSIRQGKSYGVKAGEFECRTVNLPNSRKGHIYARYVGGES